MIWQQKQCINKTTISLHKTWFKSWNQINFLSFKTIVKEFFGNRDDNRDWGLNPEVVIKWIDTQREERDKYERDIQRGL